MVITPNSWRCIGTMPKRSRDVVEVVRVSEDPLILVFPAFVDE